MSIDPITLTPGPGVASKGAAPAPAPAVPFAQYLSGTPGAEQVSASTAAEILRLKMLSSAVNLGNDPEKEPGRPSGVQGLLERFLAQLPKSGAPAAEPVSGAEPAGIATGGAAAAQSTTQDGTTGSIDAIIDKASKRYGVESGLIKAVIKAESNFNPRAVSSAGAQGLMQLMPATARGLGVSDSFDPEQNVMAGTRFLKDMLQHYGGNVDEALAAYNWGPGKVDRNGCDNLPRETRAYLGRVKGYYAQYVG